MNVNGGRHAAAGTVRSTPATSVDAGVGPHSVSAAGHWGSRTAVPCRAVDALSLLSTSVATSAVQLPRTPLAGPHWITYCSPESAPTSSVRMMTSDCSADDQTLRRDSASFDPVPQGDLEQHRRLVQQQRKRRRTCCSTDSPPPPAATDPITRSTSWNEPSTDDVESSSSMSSLLRRFHRQPCRPLSSLPYPMVTRAMPPSSLLFSPWSVEFPQIRAAAMGTVAGCFGSMLRPPAYPSPEQRPDGPVDVNDVEGERLCQLQYPQQRSLVSGTDHLSPWTDVTHQRTIDRPAFSCDTSYVRCPLTEESRDRRLSQHHLSTPPPSLVRQSSPVVADSQLSTSASSSRGRFSRGVSIQLGGGQWKRVEQLSEEDFVDSAARKTDAQLELITVAHILHNHDRNTVVVGFQLSSLETQVAVAAAREHPFFVCGKGWSSCSPQKTMDRYGLRCKRLLVGDCCLSLSQVHSSTLVQRSPSDAVSSECRPSSETGKGQLEVPLDYSTVGTRSTELGPAGAESCRPGVIRSVPAETRRRRHRSSSESTAADMASTTPD